MSLEERKFDNNSYREKFLFTFYNGENIVVQRFFKINGFRPASVDSIELKNACDDIIEMINQELVSKSRIYMHYTTPSPVKLTGFAKDGANFANKPIDGKECTFVTYPEPEDNSEENEFEDTNEEVKFRFVLEMATKVSYEDDKPVYKEYKPIYDSEWYRVWDGSCYPKYVRNSINLTNSLRYDNTKSGFLNDLDKKICTDGVERVDENGNKFATNRPDLVYRIIKNIIDVMSKDESENYTMYDKYGKKNYAYTNYSICQVGANGKYVKLPYVKKYVEGWKRSTYRKTNRYFSEIRNFLPANSK